MSNTALVNVYIYVWNFAKRVHFLHHFIAPVFNQAMRHRVNKNIYRYNSRWLRWDDETRTHLPLKRDATFLDCSRAREFLLIQNSHFEVLSALVDEFREQALSQFATHCPLSERRPVSRIVCASREAIQRIINTQNTHRVDGKRRVCGLNVLASC